MCRLALLNDEMVKYLGEDVLAYHFDALETKMGGDGMGVGALFPDGRVKTHKGVNQTSEDSAEWIIKQSNLGASHYIFHTRLATTGSKRDRNCHPFRHGSLIAAHNGSCVRYTGAGGKDLTDSEGVFYTIHRAGLGLTYLEDVSGVFIGFNQSRPFVVKGQAYTDLSLAKMGDAYMYTSNIFKEEEEWFEKVHAIKEYTWLGDEEEEGLPVIKKYYAASTSSYYKSWDTEDDKWINSGTSTGYSKNDKRYGRRLDGTWGYLTDKDLEELEDDENDYENYDVNKAVLDAIAEETKEEELDYEMTEEEAYTRADIVIGNFFCADGTKWVWDGHDFIPERSSEELEAVKKKYALISI